MFYHRLNGHEFEQTPGDGEGQGGLGCCSPWGCKELDTTEWLKWTEPFSSPGNLPNPGTKPRSFALQADSLPAEPQGKPENTGVGSLFLLQPIFLTQEWYWSLLHCRQILYQLSYQRSPSWAKNELIKTLFFVQACFKVLTSLWALILN